MNELPKVERTTLTMKETAEYLGVSYWLVKSFRRILKCKRRKIIKQIRKEKDCMQWIKIFTSIFGNPKIQLLLKERDGDTIFRIWIQLLTIAGTSAQGGKIMFSTNQPLTVEDLAKITQKTNKKIKNILDKLIHCEMIIFENNTYIIKNWEKYQSADKYEKMLEQNRERQRRFRENQKNENNVDVTLR